MLRERRRSVGWCRCSVHMPARRASPSPHPRRPRLHRRSRTWLRGWRGVRRLLSGALTMFGENNDNRHDNRCLPPGELHSPGHCTHSMDHEHKEIDARARAEAAMGRDGRHDRSAFAHGPPHHLNHASFPPFPPSLPTPLPALSPAPNRPGGRTARWAERRRRPLGPACLRRSERISRLRGSACPARLAPPACRRARSSRGRHALGCAGTAPSCHLCW